MGMKVKVLGVEKRVKMLRFGSFGEKK